MDRVLVTGGTGVIGAWVVRGLAERGVTPIVFTRGQTDAIGQAINGDIADRVVRVQGDLLDADAVERAVRDNGAQAIVHMASAKPWQLEPPWAPEPDARRALEQIAFTTLGVLEAARRTGVRRVVYASSKAVYDDVTGEHGPPDFVPLRPDYRYGPHMLYGIGKLAAEQLGFYYADRYDLEFLAIRFSSAFGPLKRGPTATSPDGMFYAALAGETVRVRRFGPGERDDFAYNKDIALGFVLAALAPTPRHRTYNLGSGQGSDHEDIARGIRHVIPDAKIEFADPDVGGEGSRITDRARCVMDISRATEDFGYVPQFFPLERAFADFLLEVRRIEAQGDRQPAAAR